MGTNNRNRRQTSIRVKKLPTLEKDILKYRTYEMVLVLFYIEQLREFLISSFNLADSMRERNEKRIPSSSKQIFKRVWKILVIDNVLSAEEIKEVQELLEYRNDIAHRIHLLTCDLSRTKIVEDYFRFRSKWVSYDYKALSKIMQYRKKIEQGMVRSNHIITVGFNEALFEAIEKTYYDEMNRLEKKIVRQIAARENIVRTGNEKIS